MVRDEATGAILRVKPRTDAPPNVDGLAFVIVKDPGRDSYIVRLEESSAQTAMNHGLWADPILYMEITLRPTVAVAVEAKRWAAYEQGAIKRETEQLAGKRILSERDLSGVAEFERGLVTITIGDLTQPGKSLGGLYHARPNPLSREITLSHGDSTFTLKYRRHSDQFRLTGDLEFVNRSKDARPG